MSDKIFPADIINHTVENHFVVNNKRFNRVYIGVIALLLIALTCLPFIKIKVTSQSRGVVRSQLENAQVQSANYGLVKYSAIKEAASVVQGDTLIVLDAGKIEEQLEQTQEQIDINSSYITDLRNLINGSDKLATDKYKQVMLQYDTELNEHELNLGLLSKKYEMAKYLYKEEVTPKMEFLKIKNTYESAVSKKNLFIKTSHNRWQTEVSRLVTENKSLNSQMQQLTEDGNLFVITAPISGTLFQTKGIQIGSLVAPGQVMAHISPNDKLIVECYVSPSDIGLIKPNQAVSFQIDAFDYNQWGLASGEVYGYIRRYSKYSG